MTSNSELTWEQRCENKVHNTLSSDAFFLVNKALLKFFEYDWSAVVILSDLISARQELELEGNLEKDDEEFYRTQSDIKNSTGIGFSTQNRSLRLLSEFGCISVVKKGMPPRNHFVINYHRINEILEETEV